MANDVIVSNTPTSSNPDIPVRTTETVDLKHIQHMRLDIGSGTSESVVTGSNPFPTLLNGTIVASNSSTTPLAGGGVFTGAAMEVTNYAVINVNVYSDVASATDGVSVQFSIDGTNWDHSHSTTYTTGSGRGYVFNAEYRYARVVYTNGATPQSAFRLQTILKTTRVQSSLYTLSQTVSGNLFAELVKAELIAKNNTNNWIPINCTNGGNLKIAVEEINDSTDTASLSNVAASASSVQLLAANNNRKMGIFVNDSDKNAYIKFGATASTTSFSYLLTPGQTLELPKPTYTGRIDCIWGASVTGSMRITEL